jgi:glyoxylase I family protein
MFAHPQPLEQGGTPESRACDAVRYDPRDMKLVPDGVHHAAIQVRDLAAAERFYVGVLGLPVVRRWPGPAGAERSLWVGAAPGGAAFLALEVVPSVEGQPTAAEETARAERPGHHLLALRIARSERAAWEGRLAAAGVPITARSDFTLYFCDPEGNRLGLSHFPDAAEPV